MKTRALFSIGGLVSALFVNGATQAELSPNILGNPSFEGSVGYGRLSSWTSSNANGNYSSFSTSGIGAIAINPYNGDYIIWNNNNTSHVELSQSGNITDYMGSGGARIYASVFTNSNKKTGVQCQMTVTYFDSASKMISQDTSGKVACATTAGIWQELKFTNTVPLNAVSLTYKLEGFTADYSGYALFDESSLMIETCDSTCPAHSPLVWGFKTVEQIIADTKAGCLIKPTDCGIQSVTTADVTNARDATAAVITENLGISLPLAYIQMNGVKTPLSAELEFISSQDGNLIWKLKSHQFK
jgi:hypothetical protein